MAKIYVVGKELNRARKIMNSLRDQKHQITYDWTINYSENDSAQKAMDELSGVRDADILVYLWEPSQESARYETGMAMGLGKKIIVSGGPDAFFFKLPDVYQVDSDEDVLKALSFLNKNQG
jgi:hypothetical protein